MVAASRPMTEAGVAKAMEGMMMKGMMMGEAMPGMMGAGMPSAAPAAVSFHNVPKAFAATGIAAGAASQTGAGTFKRLLGNPWVLFGLGVTVGYLVHKYRKDIVGAANRAAEKGKDFVLQQRENLEDIVAEAGENED